MKKILALCNNLDMLNFRQFVLAWLILVNGFFVALTNHAAAATPAACTEISHQTQHILWDQIREAGDQLYCRKSWVTRMSEEFLACGTPELAQQFSQNVANKWNAYFSSTHSGWSKLQPNAIGIEWQANNLNNGGKQVYIGVALAHQITNVEIIGENNITSARVTICELDELGQVVTTQQSQLSEITAQNQHLRIALNNSSTRLIGLVIESTANAGTFKYRTRLTTTPSHPLSEPLLGIADLHVHQFMNLAFAGRMYWGQHDGEQKKALAKEIITGHFNPNDNDLNTAISSPDIIKRGIDANYALWAFNKKTTDEGLFQLGVPGFPDYSAWPHHADRSHQQVHSSWLYEAHTRGKDKSNNLNLIVVSLVNNNILCSALRLIDPYGNVPTHNASGQIAGWASAHWGCSDDENVRRQLDAAHQMENRYSWYRIALTPWHAKQIIADGDLAVILSLETDRLLSDEEGQYSHWLNQLDTYRALGITTMQLVHESNSLYCGAATHRDLMQILQFFQWPGDAIINIFKNGSTFNADDNGYNKLGITDTGQQLVDALVQRNMPIDLAHASQLCRKSVMSRTPYNYGLYDSHTKFQRLLTPEPDQDNFGIDVLTREKEFLITQNILPEYIKHKVLLGLRTASVDVYNAPGNKVENTCPGSARSFAQLVQYAYDSGLDFAYGTDFNTGVSQLGPRFGDKRCFAYQVSELEHNKSKQRHRSRPASTEEQTTPQIEARRQQVSDINGTNYYRDGLAHIGWLPELTQDLINLGTPGAQRLRHGAEAYLSMWQRAYNTNQKPRNTH